jgi:hypothetical protein
MTEKEDDNNNDDSGGIRNALATAGFDICHSFHPKLYNDCIQKRNLPLRPLPENELGYLIGNTKRFWPIFLKWLQEQRQRRETTEEDDAVQQHPVDTYVKDKIVDVLNKEMGMETGPAATNYEIYWSDEYDMDLLVSMGWVASCSGFAYLDEITHLTVHPVYGTWHSFRAVVVIKDSPKYNPTDNIAAAITLQPCLLTEKEQESAKLAMDKALRMCEEARLSTQQPHKAMMESDETAMAWIDLRDCIVSRGKDFRFDENQLWYHYTKDVKYLEAALTTIEIEDV